MDDIHTFVILLLFVVCTVRSGQKPLASLVIYEEIAAVTGVSVAAVCLLLTHYTGAMAFDLVGELFVGGILFIVARQIFQRNADLLNHP